MKIQQYYNKADKIIKTLSNKITKNPKAFCENYRQKELRDFESTR